ETAACTCGSTSATTSVKRSTTRSTTRSCSSSIPPTKDAGWCVSKERGHEQPHLSRLAGPDGDRRRAPVQALHGGGGPASRGCADADSRPAAERRRHLLRPRPQRLLRRTYGRARGAGAAHEPLVRGA